MILFCINTFIAFIPHFAVAAGLVLVEGLIAGASYSNIYNHIYKSVSPIFTIFLKFD